MDSIKKKSNSARGLSRRLNNVMKLVKTDSKIAEIMEHRWRTSDAFEAETLWVYIFQLKTKRHNLVEMYMLRRFQYNFAFAQH